MYCAKHPNELTSLSCGRCERAICTKCLVHAPVGIRCRDCAPAQPLHARRGIGVIGGVIIVIVLIAVTGSVLGDRGTSNSGAPEDYLDEYGYEPFQGAVTVNELVDPWQPEAGTDAASPGHRFIAIEVTIENPADADDSHYVTSFDFKLTDSENFAYEATFSGAEPLLPEDLELAPGEKARGWVTFEINEENAVESLEYLSGDIALPEPASVGR